MSHADAAPGGAGGWVLPVAVLLALVGPYAWAAVRVRTGTGRRWPVARSAPFTAGAVVAALAVSPLGAPGTAGTASAHMLQHVLLGMAAPLGLVLGAPVTLGLACLPRGRRRPVVRTLAGRPVRVLTHPATAAVLHVGGLYALYLTPLYALTQGSAAVHAAVLVHFLAAGVLFAWSLAGPERAARRPGTVVRLAVLVVAAAAHGYLAKLLYAQAPALPPGAVHDAADLRLAARWMYYAGDVVEVALAALVLGAWYRRSGRHPLAGALAGSRRVAASSARPARQSA